MALLAADSFFTEGYLTTGGAGTVHDRGLCEDLELEWIRAE